MFERAAVAAMAAASAITAVRIAISFFGSAALNQRLGVKRGKTRADGQIPVRNRSDRELSACFNAETALTLELGSLGALLGASAPWAAGFFGATAPRLFLGVGLDLDCPRWHCGLRRQGASRLLHG